MKKIIIILLVVLIITCLICVGVALGIQKFSDIASETNISNETNNEQSAPEFTENKIELGIPSIYKNEINSLEPETVLLPEVELLVEGLNLLEAKGWDGSENGASLNFQDINQTKWQEWKRDDTESLEGLTIPSSLESIYTSSQAQSEIKSLAFQIRKEYINALKAKGVNSKYTEELDRNVMPEEESRYFFYFNNEPEDMPTQVEGLRGEGDTDYTKQQMHLNVIDFNNGARLLRRSGVIGMPSESPTNDTEYEKQLRNMAMRWYIYHELTHSLQRAYMNLNVSEEYRNTILPYMDYENTLIFADEDYLWKWGNSNKTDALAENYDLASESQAEGIAYEILSEGYNMSVEQKEAVWQHLFGRLEPNRVHLNNIKSKFEQNYPDLNPRYLPNYFGSIEETVPYGEDKLAYERFANKAGNMPIYAGYFNPMQPEDTVKFWAKLK